LVAERQQHIAVPGTKYWGKIVNESGVNFRNFRDQE